jgi:hypothetical protein
LSHAPEVAYFIHKMNNARLYEILDGLWFILLIVVIPLLPVSLLHGILAMLGVRMIGWLYWISGAVSVLSLSIGTLMIVWYIFDEFIFGKRRQKLLHEFEKRNFDDIFLRAAEPEKISDAGLLGAVGELQVIPARYPANRVCRVVMTTKGQGFTQRQKQAWTWLCDHHVEIWTSIVDEVIAAHAKAHGTSLESSREFFVGDGNHGLGDVHISDMDSRFPLMIVASGEYGQDAYMDLCFLDRKLYNVDFYE